MDIQHEHTNIVVDDGTGKRETRRAYVVGSRNDTLVPAQLFTGQFIVEHLHDMQIDGGGITEG